MPSEGSAGGEVGRNGARARKGPTRESLDRWLPVVGGILLVLDVVVVIYLISSFRGGPKRPEELIPVLEAFGELVGGGAVISCVVCAAIPALRRRFLVAVLAVFSGYMFVGLCYAVDARNKAREADAGLQAEWAALEEEKRKLQGIKEAIGRARSRGFNTAAEFARAHVELGPEVELYRASSIRLRERLERLGRYTAERPNFATSPTLQRSMGFAQEALKLDAEQIELILQECRYSREMEALPASRQLAFYNEKIRPLVDQETAIEEKKKRALQERKQGSDP